MNPRTPKQMRKESLRIFSALQEAIDTDEKVITMPWLSSVLLLYGYENTATSVSWSWVLLRRKGLIELDGTVTPKAHEWLAERKLEGMSIERKSEDSMRTNLIVTYEDKETVKRLGALWDPARKTWYCPDGADLRPLLKWVPAEKLKRPNDLEAVKK